MINKEEVKKIIMKRWKELEHKQDLILQEKDVFLTPEQDQQYYEILMQKEALIEVYKQILDMKEE